MPVLMTLGQAVGGLIILAVWYAALAATFVMLGRFARRMWRRNEIPQTVLGRLGQLVVCGLVVASLPILLVSLLALGCPPDAFECPA
jgi:hypothetical protein